jgi:hypothetical protein
MKVSFIDAKEHATLSLAIAQEIGHRQCETAALNLLAQIELDDGWCGDARGREIGHRLQETSSLQPEAN